MFNFTEIKLRLQGPSAENGTGRIEVFFRGQWGTICSIGWDMNDTKVACRQLGYKYAVRILPSWQVPDGSGPIWLYDVQCTGKEQSLASCYHRGWGIHYCSHYSDIGIECSSTGKLLCINCNPLLIIMTHRYHFITNWKANRIPLKTTV